MSDDTALRGQRDRSRIALNEDYEVDYWTEKLGVNREQLESAIRSVGNGVEAVTHYIKAPA